MKTDRGNTKQRIIDVSMKLFSARGYDAVSVRDIADELGIGNSALYKHYKSKQDIFEAIFAEMQRRYDEQTEKMQLHIANAIADTGKFASIDVDGLVKQLKEVVCYSIHDDYVSRFRRLMTIEQFRSPAFAALYTQRYVDRLVDYHEKLFASLVAVGAIREGDVHSMALQYTCPVLVLLSVCDRQPGEEAQVMQQIEAHVRQFWAFTRPSAQASMEKRI